MHSDMLPFYLFIPAYSLTLVTAQILQVNSQYVYLYQKQTIKLETPGSFRTLTATTIAAAVVAAAVTTQTVIVGESNGLTFNPSVISAEVGVVIAFEL